MYTKEGIGKTIARKFFSDFVKLEGYVSPPKPGTTVDECKFFVERDGFLIWVGMYYPVADGGEDCFSMIAGSEDSNGDTALQLSEDELNFVNELLD